MYTMEMFSLYLYKNQLNNLRKFPGNVSEHIRRAIDDYLKKNIDASLSNSLSMKGGGKDA